MNSFLNHDAKIIEQEGNRLKSTAVPVERSPDHCQAADRNKTVGQALSNNPRLQSTSDERNTEKVKAIGEQDGLPP